MIISFIKALLAKEATRLIAYSSAVATAGALYLAKMVGVELSAEILVGVGALAALITTEAIRRFVYSEKTTQAIADRAASTGDTDIGTPPSGRIA